MSTKEVVSEDFKAAFKSGDATAKSVLTMLKSEIKNKEIDNKGELSDDDVLSIITSEVKKRRDSQKQYSDAGRDDLAKGEEDEIAVLVKYLPEQLSEEEVTSLVEAAVSETGAEDIKDLGKVMTALKDKVKGRADGSLVAKIVKEKLS